MTTEGEADDLLQGLLGEIARLENLQKTAEAESQASRPAEPKGKGAVSYVHVRTGSPEQNPAFARGVEFARLEAGQTLEDLDPSQFLFLPEVEKDEVLAVRDAKKKAELVPGEKLYFRILGGQERYLAKVRGRVIVIGNVIHILPSDLDGKLGAKVEAGGLSAFLDIHPTYGRGRMPNLDAVKAFLEKNGIRQGLRENSILKALQECSAGGKPITNILVAQGCAPVAGKAGSIEYFFDRDFQGPLNLDLDEGGKIDFRNVKWIPLVAKDLLLARVKPSIPGADGVDVSGRVLAAKPIPKVYLVPGQNVRAENEDTEFYSEINGCVQLNGSLLDVMNVFVVNSDVDYRTGNLHFDGNIMITGTVRKGFEVEAAGDVVILGNVEPGRIKAGRDIHVKGGVLGAGKGKIGLEASRNITAGYAENAWMEAQGNIVIENFALQSFLYCSGRILLEKKRGSLVGGEAMAARGVEAKALGSPSGIKTCVAAGVDYVLKRQQAALARQAAQMKEAMVKIDRFLRSLLELSSQGVLHPSKAQALKDIAEKRKQISKAYTAATVRCQELGFQQENLEPGFIKAIEMAHPEVVITIRARSTKLAVSFYRCLFRLDGKTDQIMRGPA